MTAHHRTVPSDAALDWQHYAACASPNVDPAWFFPREGNGPPTPAVRQHTARAKAVCGGCDVRQECLADALTDPHRYGIWGGLTEYERYRQRGGAA